MNFGIILFFVLLLAVIALRLPIGIGMLSMGVIYMVATGGNIQVISQGLLDLYWTNYILISVPLFLFTANVMNASTISNKIYGFTDACVGRFRGGLAQVNILASLIFAGMSGSASADASGIGSLEIRAMRNAGYKPAFACALTATSATMSPIFPPSILMLLYSSLTGAPVGKMFMGGIVPAVVMALGLAGYVAAVAKKKQMPYGPRYAIREFVKMTINAIPALLTPAILLTCIYTGVVTPTEAGALAGLYALIVAFIAYRALSWQTLKTVLADTVSGIGVVCLMIGCASAVQYIAGYEKIPVLFADFVTKYASNKYMFLFLVNIMFLIMGMFLETNTITLVFVPIVLPLVKAFGIDLVHFGVIFCVNMMVGMCTPPYGQLLFVTSAVSGVKIGAIIKEIVPMLVIMVICLLVMTYIPQIVTFLPNLLN